ncbi:hypothetical protein LSH36_1280g00103 [Paralvinella palmiformis]|uniref:CSN8/PSMD8/EIF3K domain-containing protein n=1 Tax=Paralvinella palmiformis TaxID=53620 RepID=A0AAD9IU78_9ANNE|nr:hypothetical protein LSH36_1280g00103 [Paralvinella palmiformis]
MAVEEAIDYVKLGKELEEQEVESPGGVATAQVYGQLLAIYLLQNDMPNAKFLWKKEHTRERGFNLVGQAYSSISGEQLSVFVGLPVTEAVEVVVARGWEADAQTRMIMPKKTKLLQEVCIPTEQQMARLTDFVSFLEN